MIFVTVGATRGFDRLTREMDRIAGAIQEKVVMQIGSSSLKPLHSEYFDFKPKEEVEQLYKDARVVVCHAGVGAIINALRNSKPVIAVPRLKRFDEHIDDHQVQLAEELEKEGSIRAVYDIADLEKVLKNNESQPAVTRKSDGLAPALKEYIKQIEDSLEESRRTKRC